MKIMGILSVAISFTYTQKKLGQGSDPVSQLLDAGSDPCPKLYLASLIASSRFAISSGVSL